MSIQDGKQKTVSQGGSGAGWEPLMAGLVGIMTGRRYEAGRNICPRFRVVTKRRTRVGTWKHGRTTPANCCSAVRPIFEPDPLPPRTQPRTRHVLQRPAWPHSAQIEWLVVIPIPTGRQKQRVSWRGGQMGTTGPISVRARAPFLEVA